MDFSNANYVISGWVEDNSTATTSSGANSVITAASARVGCSNFDGNLIDPTTQVMYMAVGDN